MINGLRITEKQRLCIAKTHVKNIQSNYTGNCTLTREDQILLDSNLTTVDSSDLILILGTKLSVTRRGAAPILGEKGSSKTLIIVKVPHRVIKGSDGCTFVGGGKG